MSAVLCRNCRNPYLKCSCDPEPPEPLGLPVWNFERNDQKAQAPDQSRSVVVNRGPQPAGGILGLPVWEF